MVTASTVYRPGPLFYYDAAWKPATWHWDDPGSYTPGSPWADDVDATSHLLTGYAVADPVEYHSTSASADFPTLPAGTLGIELAVRWSFASLDVGPAEQWNVYLSDAVTGDILDGMSPIIRATGDTEPQWFTESFMYDYYSGATPRASAFMPSPTVEFPQDMFRIHEIKLTAFHDAPAAPYVPPTMAHPSLRMLQRGGAGGMAGVPRLIGNPTIRGSVRRGPGSIL